jgi:ubiquinone/menaquinone biosynthesis C-methylase UbiE
VPQRDAAYFDQWYADMAASPVRDEIVASTLGLPAELAFASILTWDGIAEVTAALRLAPDALLLDIACGRGGYGIEVARRTSARLIGIDFSAVALREARANSARRVPSGTADFRIGTLTSTGLPSGSARAVMCVDAVQFADPPLAALHEFRRILAPAGRVALTCWEASTPSDNTILRDGVPDDGVPARIRAVDLRRDLTEAGFTEVEVREMPEWREAERALWEAAVVADPADPAVRSLQNEGRRSLATFGSLRRVFATATAP